MIAFCQPPPPEERLPRVSRRQWYGAAIHEAGHAVACLVAGWELLEVAIGPEPCGKGQTSIGRCRPDIDHLRRPDARGAMLFPGDYQFRRAYCRYTLAGPTAEFCLLDEPPEKPCSDDMKYAKEDAETVFPGDAEYQRKFILLCGDDARLLVNEYAAEIQTVARALLRHGRLTGAEVNALVFPKELNR